MLAGAREVFLRTRQHPAVAGLPPHLKIHSFDGIYEAEGDFVAVYEAIAREVLARAEKGDVLYAVPGHPRVGERSVARIMERAQAREIPVRLVAGLSFVDAALLALSLDPLARGLQVVDALDLAREHFPRLDTDRPALVGQLYSRAVASDVKLTLLANYPPDYAVTLIHAAATPEQKLRILPLAELDRADDFGLLAALYIPPFDQPSSPQSLAEIMATLRAPEGCPWDREQTPQSLRGALLEETYEVLDALDREDTAGLREELGDLLLHVLFQTEMASEAGEFTLAEVGAELASKLIRRHPHVFGEVKVQNASEVVENWQAIKAREKAGKPDAAQPKEAVPVPRELPALVRAQKVYKKLKKERGTPKADVDCLPDLARRVQAPAQQTARAEQALGALLFQVAILAAEHDLDAESALRRYTAQYSDGKGAGSARGHEPRGTGKAKPAAKKSVRHAAIKPRPKVRSK